LAKKLGESRRAVYTRLIDMGNLTPFRFAQVYYTNLGESAEVNTSLVGAGKRAGLQPPVLLTLPAAEVRTNESIEA